MSKLLLVLCATTLISLTQALSIIPPPIEPEAIPPQDPVPLAPSLMPDLDQSEEEFYKRVMWGQTEKKLNVDEIVNSDHVQSLKCLKHTNFGKIIKSHLQGGFEHLNDQLGKGVTANKRYYLYMEGGYNLFYFKQRDNYFIHLNQVIDGEEETLITGFREVGDAVLLPGMDSDSVCIKELPDNCLWHGQRRVQYEEVCESGLDVAHTLRDDILKISFKERLNPSDDSIDPTIIAAIAACYKPQCYSISYDCFKKGFAFDSTKALEFLTEQAKKFTEKGYFAVVNSYNFSVKYSRRRIEIEKYMGENPSITNPIWDAKLDITSTEKLREINKDGTVPEEPAALPVDIIQTLDQVVPEEPAEPPLVLPADLTSADLSSSLNAPGGVNTTVAYNP